MYTWYIIHDETLTFDPSHFNHTYIVGIRYGRGMTPYPQVQGGDEKWGSKCTHGKLRILDWKIYEEEK